MSYSRQQLYALGETFGDSATELKVNGSRTYGGGGGKGDKPKRIPIRPANVSTGFGTATANPQTGDYSYTLDPHLAQMRDIFYGGAEQFQPTAQDQQFARDVSNQGMGVFNQGQNFLNQALAQNPNQTAQQYYSDIQNLMSMDRAQEESRLANSLFRSGRTGVATGVDGGFVNPEQFALLRARELANTQLGIQAQQLGRQQQQGDAAFGNQLMASGLSNYGSGFAAGATPFNTMAGIFGLGTGIEGLGNNTLGQAMSAAQMQMAAQQQQQQTENARASAGKGGGGLLGAATQLGGMYLNAKTGGATGAAKGVGSLLGGSSPTSGIGSLFGSNGFGNNVGTWNSTWNPISTNIGMGGFQGPANFGGGTIGPRF